MFGRIIMKYKNNKNLEYKESGVTMKDSYLLIKSRNCFYLINFGFKSYAPKI